MAIQKNSIRVILSNLFKTGYFLVLFDKLKSRLREPGLSAKKQKALNWCQSVGIAQDEFCRNLDSELYERAVEYNQELRQDTKSRLNELPVKMGGPGDITLAYFMTILHDPKVIVETGVSMGFTSRTFLEAMSLSGGGKLYSSDFPYFRLKNPEKYIGWVVSDNLRKNWTLLIEGDLVNIPKILGKVEKVDLFHYDSDKSFIGRKRVWELILPKLTSSSVTIFDDIDDNLHFKEEVYEVYENAKVLKSRFGGYVGILVGRERKKG